MSRLSKLCLLYGDRIQRLVPIGVMAAEMSVTFQAIDYHGRRQYRLRLTSRNQQHQHYSDCSVHRYSLSVS